MATIILHIANEETVSLHDEEGAIVLLNSAFPRYVGDIVSMGSDRQWVIAAIDWFSAPSLDGGDRISYCYVLPKGESADDPRAEQKWWRERYPEYSLLISEECGQVRCTSTCMETPGYEIGNLFSVPFNDPETGQLRVNRSLAVAGVKTYLPVGDSPLAGIRFLNLVKAKRPAKLALSAA